MINNFQLPVFFSILLLLFTNCGHNVEFDQYETLSDETWSEDNTLNFEAVITDTSAVYNVFINVRNRNEYPMSNLFLFVNTTAPSGNMRRDTVEIPMADVHGKWYGKSVAGIWQHSHLFKKHVKFPIPGEYQFEVTQAMRMEELPGIVDAGIRITRVTQ